MIGQTISHYKILEKLGEGGMGVVYKAEDTRLKRPVALKFLPAELTRDEESKERFVHEAQAASALQHNNICTIHDIDETDEGQMFICMDYYEGETLKKKIARGPMPVQRSIDTAIQVAEGLEKAHKQGIVHRDIKPANLMVTRDGVVKIVDFGLAKLAGKTRVTKTGTTVGTVAYMSPEQARGEAVDQRTDIWSLGVLLYEMLTGQLPFRSDYEQAVMYSILNEEPKPLSELRPDLPEVLQQLVSGALQKDPDKRPQSVNEILHHLSSLQGEAAGTPDINLHTLVRFLKRPRHAIVLLTVLAIIAAAVIMTYRTQLRRQHAKELLPQVEKLAEAEKYLEAYKWAVQAEATLGSDSTLVLLWPEISDNLTVFSEPAGAKVYLRHFAPQDLGKLPERGYLGVTPIRNLRIAHGSYNVYVEKEGYVSAVHSASGITSADVKLEFKLLEMEKAREDMVFVPGGKYRLVGWGTPTTAEVPLVDYFIDKYEVSNQQYRDFMEAGGYRKKQFWKHLFIKNGQELSWDEAMPHFVDRTGLPGPRTWVNQNFPEGKVNYPVTDISWYEAAAYSEFAGKNLATIFQWEKAARDGAFTHGAGMMMPWGLATPKASSEHRANFEGQATAPVDSYAFGISPYGCYNMAGNVKEWCLNEFTGGYAVVGGSWEDPPYLFASYGVLAGFQAFGSLGFRCVRLAAGSQGDQGAMKINLEKKTPVYSAVDETMFRSFLNIYKYDKTPVQAQLLEKKETADWIREKIIFPGVYQDPIIAYLYLPKQAAKPFQCLNFLPHFGIFVGTAMAEIAEHNFAPHIKSGRALLAVVPKGAVEREWGEDYVFPKINTVKYREQAVRLVTEWRIALDYLTTRDDIDADKLACVGISWGVQSTALVSLAVEIRYRTVIMIGSGVGEWDTEKLPEANPINFAPYIKPPKLIIHGKYDEDTPLETQMMPLYNLLREPKRLEVVDEGHVPSLETRVPIINKWLDETLGPVKFLGEEDEP